MTLLFVLPMMMGLATNDAVAGNKLFVGGLAWDTSDQAIKVSLEVHKQYLQRTLFFAVTFVTIFDPENGEIIDEFLSEPQLLKPIRPLEDRIVIKRVEPLSIPWDRIDGTYSRLAGVEVTVQVVDSRGEPVKKLTDKGFGFIETGTGD